MQSDFTTKVEEILSSKLKATERDVLPNWRDLPLTLFPLLLESELHRAKEWVLFACSKNSPESWKGVSSSMASFLVLSYMCYSVARMEDVSESDFVSGLKNSLTDLEIDPSSSSSSSILFVLAKTVDDVGQVMSVLETSRIPYEENGSIEKLGALATLLMFKAFTEAKEIE